MKNVLVFALNKLQENDNNFFEFMDENNEFHQNVKYINEVSIKYVMYKFERENKALDFVFVFILKEYFDMGYHEKIKEIFPKVSFEFLIVNSKFIKENLILAPKMLEKIIEYKNSVNDDINVSLDLTCEFIFNSTLMSLIRLLKYNNLETNYIFYANTLVYPNVIEEISDFVNLPNLIDGAEEFILRGSTDKVQKFFENNSPNEHIKHLLDKMTALSDTLRVCGSYELTENALVDLGDAIKNYELFLDIRLKNLLDKTNELSDALKKCESYKDTEEILKQLNAAMAEYREAMSKKENINVNEFYFSKLLPRIKLEYGDILPKSDKKSSPIEIIKWCLKMGLIQQAVTFYAEWLPRFLVENNYISVMDKNIKEECNTNLWSHWSNTLFRNYQVKYAPAAGRDNINFNNALPKELRPAFETGTVSNVLQLLSGRDLKLESTLKYIQEFSQKYNTNEVCEKILQLPDDDDIKKLLQISSPKNTKFKTFITRRMANEGNIEKILVKALAILPKNQWKYFYGNEINPNTKNSSHKKLRTRRDVFEYLLQTKKLSTSMDKENLLNFVERYDLIVRKLRNKFAHAISDSDTVENQEDIVKIIEDSLDLINVK